jgi:hypothetical protein
LQLSGKWQFARARPLAHDAAPIVGRTLKKPFETPLLFAHTASRTITMFDEKVGDNATSVSSGGVGETSYKRDTSFLGKLRTFEATLDAKLGIESDAITRKLPEDKGHVPWHQQMNMFFLWASGTMNTSCFATGFLGLEFGLSKMFCVAF